MESSRTFCLGVFLIDIAKKLAKRRVVDSDSDDTSLTNAPPSKKQATDPIDEVLDNIATPSVAKRRLAHMKPAVNSPSDDLKESSPVRSILESSPVKQSSPKAVKAPSPKAVKSATKKTSAALKTSEAKPTEEEEESATEDEAPLAVLKAMDSSEQVATWTAGEKVPYSALCQLFEKIEATTKRLIISSYITKFFKQVIQLSPDNLLPCLYLCINRLCPEYEGLELGVGETLLMKAVAGATGRNVAAIKKQVEEVGDLGTVAQTSRSGQMIIGQPRPLNVPGVFATLKDIAKIEGNKSMEKKIDKIKGMLVACKGNETKYLIRSMEGKLRIGSAEKTVLVSLAHASVLARNIKVLASPEELTNAAEIMKQVYSEMPNYDQIVPVLLKDGISGVEKSCKLSPGIPLKPMLAHPTKSITEVLTRFENIAFTCEWKYDGERAQIHRLENGKTFIYSRNSENMSAKYPDVMERLSKITSATSFVLDCEAVAFDSETQRILPFQVLSTRKRKDVATKDITVQAHIFAFDLLYLNGEPLIRESLQKRRELLHHHFIQVPAEFSFATYKDCNSIEEIQTFLDESIAGNCEGLMVKTLDKEASYEPSKRSRNWLKVKKDYLSEGAADSLDLVVIGAYIGRGKRTGVYGAFLLACYDEDQEMYQSICKIGTGFSEEDLLKHSEFFKQHVISEPRPYYQYSEDPRVRPDVWFDPVQVWEVKCADLSISPVHMAAAGMVDDAKGISLRFPRFIKIRDDKNVEDATSASQVAEMYQGQAIFQQEKKGKRKNNDDY